MLDSVLSHRAETHAVVGELLCTSVELVSDSGGPVTGLWLIAAALDASGLWFKHPAVWGINTYW